MSDGRPIVGVLGYAETYPPFLSIVTRRHVNGEGRGDLFLRNKASVRRQTDLDLEHVIIADRVGRGIVWANGAFGQYKIVPNGRYIYVLDDDDQFIDRGFVADLKQVTAEHDYPEIVRVKMNHGGNVWPSSAWWGTWHKSKPIGDKGGFSSFVVKAEVWKRHIDAAAGPWGGDHRFLLALHEGVMYGEYRVYWHDKIVSRTNQVGGGR